MIAFSRWALAASMCIAVAAFAPVGGSLAQDAGTPQTQEQAQTLNPAPTQPAGAGTAGTETGGTSGTPASSSPELTAYDHVRNILFALTVVLALVGVVALAWGVFLLIKAMIDTVNDRGEVVAVYSNWGGFGGSLGGWSLSRALSLLLGATLLAAIAVGLTNVVLKVVDPQRKDTIEEQQENDSGSSSKQGSEGSNEAGEMKMKKATGNEKEPRPEDLDKTD